MLNIRRDIFEKVEIRSWPRWLHTVKKNCESRGLTLVEAQQVAQERSTLRWGARRTLLESGDVGGPYWRVETSEDHTGEWRRRSVPLYRQGAKEEEKIATGGHFSIPWLTYHCRMHTRGLITTGKRLQHCGKTQKDLTESRHIHVHQHSASECTSLASVRLRKLDTKKKRMKKE